MSCAFAPAADPVPRQLGTGDPRHGVLRYAREVAEGAERLLGRPVPLTATSGPAGTPHHLHFTERLWGPGPAAAAGHVERIAARVPISLTLHDLPGPGDSAARVDAYRRVVAVARGVAVSSHHEARLLGQVTGVVPTVIPLPVHVHPAPSERPAPAPVVALLGFVYPGKGHREAIEAVAELGPGGLGVVAVGGAAAGHADELASLHAYAAELGVSFSATGYLGEAALLEHCRRVAVPLAAHRHVSASGSINSWIGAGRRPLVPEGSYTRELDRLRPGTLTRYRRRELPAVIERARSDPGSTWWATGAEAGPGFADVARAYLAWWRDGVAW